MTSKISPLEDIVDPVKTGLAGIDKKIRNLEKKKKALDTLREEVKKSGKQLNEDQSLALSRYEDILQQLETFRELQKQFQSCSSDIQNCYKKILKKEQAAENYRLFELERYRAVIRALDVEEIHKAFTDSCEVYSAEDAANVKILRKIVLPLRSDFVPNDVSKTLDDYLKMVAVQQANLINGRPVQLGELEVIKEAKELMDRLVTSQYFSNHPEILYIKPTPKLTSTKDVPRDTNSAKGSAFPAAPLIPAQPGSYKKADPQDLHHANAGPIEYHYGVGEPIKSLSFVNSSLSPSKPVPAQSAAFVSTGVNSSGFAAPSSAVSNTSPVNTFPAGVPVALPISTSIPLHNNQSSINEAEGSYPDNGTATMGQKSRYPPAQSYENSKSNGDQMGGKVRDFHSSHEDQENHNDNDDSQAHKNRRGGPAGDSEFNNSAGCGGSFRGRGAPRGGRPYEERRSFDDGRGGRRSFDDGRGRGGYGDRGGDRDRGGNRGGAPRGRYVGENRAPRGNGYDNEFVSGDADIRPKNVGQSGGGGSEPNDNDFGVFHVENPAFKGRKNADDRRGFNRGARGGPTGNYGRGGRGDYQDNYDGTNNGA